MDSYFIGGKTTLYVHTTNNVVLQTVRLQRTLHDMFVCVHYLVLTHRNIESTYK